MEASSGEEAEVIVYTRTLSITGRRAATEKKRGEKEDQGIACEPR
jgi:hypothetical protein